MGNLTSLTQGYAQAALNHLGSLVSCTGFTDLVLNPARFGPIPWLAYPPKFNCLRMLPSGASRELVLSHTTVDELSCVLKREDVKYIGMTALDTDRCLKWAAVGINVRFTKLIVPSEHSRKAAIKGGVKIPVLVVPHCIHSSHWKAPRPIVDKNKEDYIFYYVGSWNARKNPEGIVRAFCRAFLEGEAKLYLKLTGPDSLQIVAQHVVEEENKGKLRKDVYFSIGALSEKEMRIIHAYGDCYVSAHRGEAFGLAIMEAALLDKPVIASNWSGPTEFLSVKRGDYLISGSEVNVSGMDGCIQFTKDQVWFEPSIDDLVQAMQFYRKHKINKVEESDLQERFSWETCGPIFRKALGV